MEKTRSGSVVPHEQQETSGRERDENEEEEEEEEGGRFPARNSLFLHWSCVEHLLWTASHNRRNARGENRRHVHMSSHHQRRLRHGQLRIGGTARTYRCCS